MLLSFSSGTTWSVNCRTVRRDSIAAVTDCDGVVATGVRRGAYLSSVKSPILPVAKNTHVMQQVAQGRVLHLGIEQ